MSLCNNCTSIPFRALIEGSKSLPTTVISQFDTPKYHHRSHDSIQHVERSAQTCEFCRIIADVIKSSFWHDNMMTDEDQKKPVWLRLTVGFDSPTCSIYLGDEKPETSVFGTNIQMYPPLNGPLSGSCRLRYVYQDPLCENALSQIDEWLETCRLDHGESCDVARKKMELPTRVIDLSAMPTRKMMLADDSWSELFLGAECRLVENKTQKLGYYTALSYCWGLSTAYMTTKSTLEGRLVGFEFALLPKSLQDGIMLTRFLGLQYIWIDCLCIVQDNEDDWNREAGRMGDIYSKSYLTIAAARSSDSKDGFLAPRETKMMNLISLEDAEGPLQLGFRVYDISAAPGSFETVVMEPLQAEPLTTRAWTLQERLLAPRSLHFGKEQTYWECPQTSICENGETFGAADEEFRLDYIVEGLKAESQFLWRWRWYKLLRAYTSRSMTKPTDKLPALSGIAAAIQRQTKDTYYAGIWGKNFLVDLLWRLEDPGFGIYKYRSKNAMKPDVWRAPSWSWASVDGVIRHSEVLHTNQPCAELEFCSVTPIGENLLGGVQYGFAQIRAPLTRVLNVALERLEGSFECDIEVQDGCVRKAKLYLDFERRDECLVLMMTPISGLAVEKVDGAEETYVRIGVVQIRFKVYEEALLEVSLYPVPKSIRLL